MRRFIYDRNGEAYLYITGAGALFNASNTPLGIVHDEQVVSLQGGHLGWFDGQLLWNVDGRLLGFVKGTLREGLELPKTRPLTFTPKPTPVSFRPLLVPREKPPLLLTWSDTPLSPPPLIT